MTGDIQDLLSRIEDLERAVRDLPARNRNTALDEEVVFPVTLMKVETCSYDTDTGITLVHGRRVASALGDIDPTSPEILGVYAGIDALVWPGWLGWVVRDEVLGNIFLTIIQVDHTNLRPPPPAVLSTCTDPFPDTGTGCAAAP